MQLTRQLRRPEPDRRGVTTAATCLPESSMVGHQEDRDRMNCRTLGAQRGQLLTPDRLAHK